MALDAKPVETDVDVGGEPESSLDTALPDAGRRTGSCASCGLFAVVTAVVAGCVFYFFIAPLFLEEVDPDLGGPEIKKVAGTTNVDKSPELRGSITDYLVTLPGDDEPEGSDSHPLDRSLHVARLGLEKIRNEVRDYTALLVKQERVKGELLPEEFMRVKVRHTDKQRSIDKAFYVRHVKPQNLAGQEAIWIENQNDGKLIAHGAGWQRFVKVHLPPTGMLAMNNNRYPITELGIETLIVRMIEKGERDRQYDECVVTCDRDIEFDGHKCTTITITHPEPREHFEFHVARIYIDDELDLPVGYEGYLWPEDDSGEPVLLERYFYRELEINPGLTDLDFDPANPDYDYP